MVAARAPCAPAKHNANAIHRNNRFVILTARSELKSGSVNVFSVRYISILLRYGEEPGRDLNLRLNFSM
jgi:hypothetical protein